MDKSKVTKKNQKYEEYWKITLAYTDFYSEKFNITLKMIVDFIDENKGIISSEDYKELQNRIYKVTPMNEASIRKAINQFLKLGFINNSMESYHIKTKEFLKEKNKSRKKRIYSEILYDNASFNRSFSNRTNEKELNFLIKTLEHCGYISKDNLLAIMFQNINHYSKGYINLDELNKITQQSIMNKNDERKYNQLSYLYNICKNTLTGIYVDKEGNLTLDRDEQIQELNIKKGRDPYKQRLYKYDLYQECKELNNKIICYFEEISYPVLIASHIKPYSKCTEEEQFDVNNGLLLSKNIDDLFDKGWITFNNDGKILCADNLDDKLKNILNMKNLDKKYLKSEKRLEYLKYHRENVFNKNKKYNTYYL